MAENIPSLDDLLKNIRDEDQSKSSSALAVVPKKPKDLVEEDIDSRILSILGLEDIFDLTYEEYSSLLKEASIKGRMPGSKMTTESVQLVTDEYRRVKEKTGRFKVKKKKIDINKVLNRKQPTPPGAIVKRTGLVSPIVSPTQDVADGVKESQRLEGDLINGLGSILDSLIVIRTILQNQNKIQTKSIEGEKKNKERQKRKEREKRLEGKATVTSKEESKLRAPVTSFFDAIKRFITNVLLGSVVLGLFKWLKNPVNKGAIEDFTKFLTDNAPLILGGLLAIAALPIASTLLGLTGAVLGGVGTLTKAIGGLGALLLKIPGLGGLLGGAGPIAGAIALGGASAVGVTLAMKGTYDLIRGQIAGGEDFAKVDEQLRNKLGGYGITESGQAMIKGKKQFGKLSASQQKVYEEIQGKRNELKKLKEERDAKIRAIELDKKYYSQKSPRSARVLSKEGEKKIQEIRSSYNQKATELFGEGKSQVQPQTPMMPGLPPSAAQPGTGPAGNQVGSPTRTIIPTITSRYGAQRGSKSHGGTDLAVDNGTPLAAVSDGQIIDSGVDSGGWGNFLVFKDSQGINHLYGHIQDGYKKSGFIKKGEVIAKVGMTGRTSGPHLHWESGTGWTGNVLVGKFDPLKMYSSTAPFTFDPSIETKLTGAQLAPSAPTVPSIPSPTGGNIAMLPLPIGLGQQPQGQSNSAPLQTPVPSFSSEDPNNMTTLVVKAIYNVVG